VSTNATLTQQEQVATILDDLRGLLREPALTGVLCRLLCGQNGDLGAMEPTTNASVGVLVAARGILGAAREEAGP
jgi:hypothetical protein